MTDIENLKSKNFTPSANQIRVHVDEEKITSSRGEKKFKSYFKRLPSNISKIQNGDVQQIHTDSQDLYGSKNSDGFPGSSSDESAEDFEGNKKAYTTIVDFDETNINQLVHFNRDSGQFANIWSIIIVISTTYNFITCWYFLGIVGFPNGYWLTIEIVIEIILFFDFFIRIYVRNAMPNTWKTMWLMQHQKQSDGGLLDYQNIKIFLASIPQSWIFYLIFGNRPQILISFPIAASRILKLFRFPQIDKFFDVKEIESQVQKTHRSMRKIQVVFYFLLATHLIGCIWLIMGRIDPNRQNWFAMARYNGPTSLNNNREVTPIEMYVDAVFYCVATMTGLGYGNIVPSTNLEYFICIIIMIAGSSIYAGFFADFAVEIYIQNKKTIENEQKLEQAKQFSMQRNLPDELRTRIRLYYNNARISFQILKAKFQILHELPVGLRGELSLFFNNELIQKVKFFQLAEPSFILAMSRSLSPQICLQKDYVVYLDQVATKMFFIQQGIVQILATDYITVIALQSEGCYFGEIGVLLKKKHSCSVKAVTMCNFMTISKGELETIFESFPQQAKFLRAVGRQRLLTTKPEDLDGYEENIFEAGNGEKVRVEDIEYQKVQKSMLMSTYLTKSPSVVKDSKILSQKKGLSSSQRIKSLNTSMSVYNIRTKVPLVDIVNENLENIENKNVIDNQINLIAPTKPVYKVELNQNSKWSTESKRFLPWHLTEDFKDETKFVIIPFSHVFNMWTIMMMLSTTYFIFMVPYQLALDYNIFKEAGLSGLVPDVIFNLSFISDIFLRSRLAFITDDRGGSEITTDLDQIQAYYVNRIMIFDVLAGIPFEYLMLPLREFGHIGKLTTIMRLLKFLKAVRIYETINIVKRHSNLSTAFITFALMFALFLVLAHFMACIYIFIGIREVGKNHRFDGQDMFEDMTNRPFMTPTNFIENQDFPFLGPVELMEKFQIYIQLMYLSCGTMGAVMFGDIIPFAMAEQLYGLVAMFTCRIFLAFLFAEGANYLSSLHESASQHTKTVEQIKQWSELNQLPEVLKNRIDRFYQILWKKFKGVRQQQILEDLPVTLRLDARLCLFKDIIENWEVMIGNEDHGVVSSIIENFELRIIPQDEFIIKFGEIAQDMYFIVKGQVNCISSEGIHLSQIGMGKIFGAEILQKGSVRTSTIQAATDVSVAVMTTEDFLKICELYPSFKKRILQIVINRDQENKEQIIKVTEETKFNEIKGGLLPENLEKNLDKDQTISDDQDVESAPNFRVTLLPLNNQQKIINSYIQLTEQIPPIVNSLLYPPQTNIEEEHKQARKLISSERDQNSANSAYSRSEFLQEQEENSKKKRKEKNDSCQGSDVSKSRKSSSEKTRKTRFTRVSLKAGGINEYFEIGLKKNQNNFKHKFKLCTAREFMRWSILIIASYNFLFIPIQFAFRVKFDGFVLFMEILTIVFYILDIYFRVQTIKLLENGGGVLHESENQSELTTMLRDRDQFAKRIKMLKIEITCSTIAVIPISLIFQSTNFHEPLALVNILSLLRIVKVLPIYNFFVNLKAKNQQKWRVIEVMIYYWLFTHLGACLFISMGLWVEDVRETWLRKVPVPQVLGMRTNPTMDDVTHGSIYLHALWFTTNTVSHIAVGDISPVTSSERVFVAMLIWVATFVYSFLFGNIVSIVSDFAPVHQMLYFEKYQYVMQRLGPMKNNKNLVRSINEYFDYIWGTEQFGSVEELFKNDLPQCLRQDILLSKYQDAIEGSLIFKDDSGAVDVSLANSIIRLMKIRIYMTNEYVFKVGSLCPQTYVVLEGQAVLAGACRFLNRLRSPHDNDEDIIGIVKVGCHFGTDLPNNKYNYQQKTTCHMISTQLSVLGVLSQDNLESLYRSFPDWKKKIQSLNQFIFNKCELNLNKHQSSINKKIRQKVLQYSPARKNEQSTDKEYRMLYLENHITYSNEDVYDQITQSLDQYLQRQNSTIQVSNADLVTQQKIFFYGQEGKVFPIFDSEYQQALKKTSHKTLSLIAQVLSGDARPNEQVEEEDLDWQEKLQRQWDKFYFKENSRARKLVDSVQTINCLYIAISTPLVVGYTIEMRYQMNLLESISLLLSIAWLITNFRTQAQIKGQPTLKYATLLKHYKNNGLYIDILGILPFNIMLGQHVPAKNIVIRSIFRMVRVFSSWKAVDLIFKAEVSYKNNKINVFFYVMKATFCIYFLGHFIACTFFFVCDNIEEGQVKTWIDYQNLLDKPVGVRYLRCLYCVYNIVCSVGSGDIYPTTDQERFFFILMVSIGDLLFAVAFGLIASLTMQISLANETKQFRDKMYQIQEFMTSFNLDNIQQRRVEQFFAYQYKQKFNSHLINYDELIVYLPHSLSEEVLYQSCKSLLTSMFREYHSENLIRKLAVVLGNTTYLPGDYILYKGDIGEEMYFIAEGSVRSLSDDKQTVNRSLHKGKFFGESAILYPTKRSNFVQAETFCIIRVLTGEDFRQVARDFPDIHKQLQERAEKTKEESSEEDSITRKGGATDAMQILSTTELKRFHEDHMKPQSLEVMRHNSSGDKKGFSPMIIDMIPEESDSQDTNSIKKGEDSKSRNSEQIKELTSRQSLVDITYNEPGEPEAQESQGQETKILMNSDIMVNRFLDRSEEEILRDSLSNVDPNQINSSSDQIEAKIFRKLSPRLNLQIVQDEVESVDNSSQNDLSESKSYDLTSKKIQGAPDQHPDILDFFSDDESSESDNQQIRGTPDYPPRRTSIRRISLLSGHEDVDQQMHTPAPNNRKGNAKNLNQASKKSSKTDLDTFFSATGERKNGELKQLIQKQRDSQTNVMNGDKSPRNSELTPKVTFSDPNMKKYVRLIIDQQRSQNRKTKNVKFSPEVKTSSKKQTPIQKPSIADLFKETSNDNTCHTIRRMTVNVNNSEKRIKNPEKPLKLMPVRRLSRVCLGKNLVLSTAAGLKLQWTVTS